MSDRSPDINPYAPPKADLQGPAAVGGLSGPAIPPTSAQMAEALARLKQHVASAQSLAEDARAAGGPFRPVTLAFVALFVLALIVGAAVALKMGDTDNQTPLAVAGIAAAFCGILAAALLVTDLTFGKRATPATPDVALKRFLRALSTGRPGFAWAALSPTARAQTVVAPKLGPIATGEGQFSLATPAGLKTYAQSFARPGQKLMRTMRAKRLTVLKVEGDVAVVEATLLFQAWPQWVTILFGVSAGVFRPAIIIAVILFFVMRKRLELTVTKTLLQGQPGVWYLLDGNALEGAQPPAGA